MKKTRKNQTRASTRLTALDGDDYSLITSSGNEGTYMIDAYIGIVDEEDDDTVLNCCRVTTKYLARRLEDVDPDAIEEDLIDFIDDDEDWDSEMWESLELPEAPADGKDDIDTIDPLDTIGIGVEERDYGLTSAWDEMGIMAEASKLAITTVAALSLSTILAF